MSEHTGTPRASRLGLSQELQDAIVSILDNDPPLYYPNINELPHDLRDAITKHLKKQARPYYPKAPSLLSLSRTCRALYATCLPFIYTNIAIHPIYREGRSLVSGRLALLLRTLSSPSTHLGKHIRVLKIRSIYATDTFLTKSSPTHRTSKLLKRQIIVQYFNDRPFQGVDMPHLIRALNSIAHSLTELEIMYKAVFLQNQARLTTSLATRTSP